MIIPGFYAAARSVTAPMLTMGMTLFTFTRTRELRRIPEGCRLIEVKAWGGGGAGPTPSAHIAGQGGAGGYATYTFEVTPGEVIAIEVGSGGELGEDAGDIRGGYGGWPDGGDGARGRGSRAGGGGGSTRLWVRGVLSLIAAGGGGGGSYTSSGGRGGIAGGINRPEGGSNTTATGGGLLAGGVPIPEVALVENPAARGSYLQGGRGYAGAINVAGTRAGGGGGGGYWGGGAGGLADSLYTGHGGGGSSYTPTPSPHIEIPRFSAAAVTRIPVNIEDADYPGNSIAYGGMRSSAGNPGALVVHAYPDDPQPVQVTQEYLSVITTPSGAAARVTQQDIHIIRSLP